MKIKNVKIKNNLFLAPMAGYTDVGFRKLAKKYGVGLTCTEMISAKALTYNNKKTYDLLVTSQSEVPVAVQLFGNDPEVFEQVAKLKCLEKFDIIDINMGCPAIKIFKNNEGSALLNDIDRAESIVQAIVNNTSKPVTVKFRSGIDLDHIVAVEFAKRMEKAGASALTIHARTKEQGYSGKADLEIAKAVKDAVKIPVIVSGDCVDLESYLLIKQKTGCDGVMIGRASLGNPEIFAQILQNDIKVNKFFDIKEHINELLKYFPERFVVLTMRSHLAFYLKKSKVSVEQRLKINKAETIKEVLEILEQIFQ